MRCVRHAGRVLRPQRPQCNFSQSSFECSTAISPQSLRRTPPVPIQSPFFSSCSSNAWLLNAQRAVLRPATCTSQALPLHRHAALRTVGVRTFAYRRSLSGDSPAPTPPSLLPYSAYLQPVDPVEELDRLHNYNPMAEEEREELRDIKRVEVESFCLARTFDLPTVSRVFAGHPRSTLPTVAVFRVDVKGDYDLKDQDVDPDGQYVAVFQYGAVVLLNAPRSCLERITSDKAANAGLLPSTEVVQDDFLLVVHAAHPEMCTFAVDALILRDFDFNALGVIAQVLSQTVAMEYYEARAENMISQFQDLNRKLENDMTVSRIGQPFRLLAVNNAILSNMMIQLKVLDRSDTAWRYGQYDRLWRGLRDEFEVHERFATLEFKLQHVGESTKFLLEMMHNQHSDLLEWLIIALLTVELLLIVYEIKLNRDRDEREMAHETKSSGK